MSSDAAMFSDDDRPFVAKSDLIGHDDNVPINVNGHVNGAGQQEAYMSEDEDDDMPLSQVTATKSESMTPARSTIKRKRPAYAESSSEDDTPLASSSPVKARSAAVPMPGAVKATTVPASLVNGNVKDEDSDDYDDVKPPTKKKRTSNGKALTKKKAKKESGTESEDDQPIVKKKRPSKKKVESADDADSEDEKPIKKISKKKAYAKNGKVKKEDEDTAASDVPKPKKRANAKKDGDASPKKGKTKEEAEEEAVYRWWEAQDPDGDGTEKWKTLEHSGVFFPPPYEPLPSNVKMKYNGQNVQLPPAAEEVAGFYAAVLETDHAQDKTFNKNFFDDWKKVLKEHPPLDGTKITNLNLCDFRPIYDFMASEKEKKKTLTTAEKKELKKQKDEMEEKYTWCLLDGRKEKVGNFRVEPPGLFRGRGEHPKKGALKFRLRPEDITLNIGKGVPVPEPNMPGKWKKVINDQTVTWLANWTENINGNHKYVFLAAGSSLKGQSDMIKFEKARELKSQVDRIRQDYGADLKNKVMADRQRATAMYFIDRLALRAGNEKGEDEADTVGCCSLRCEHVTLELPNFLIFDFLGKDSIRYFNRVAVETQVFKNIRIFKENKTDDDNIFDRVNTSLLNKHLASYMKGLTAKVFRTYNASITFQQQLDENTPTNATVQEKLNAYNHANRMVAILCNHQRSAPKTHEQSMGKMNDRLRGLKYERMKLRHVLFKDDAKYKKQKKYAQDESDIDDDWIVEHEEQMKAKEIEKTEKKFAKDNEKLVADGKNPMKDAELKDKLSVIEEDFKRLKKERGTGKATLKRERAPEKIEEAIDKLEEKIKTFKLQIEDREAGKEVALGTSKINYLDPRITAAWCKTHDVPIEKIFSKTLLVKFPWAMEVESEWKF